MHKQINILDWSKQLITNAGCFRSSDDTRVPTASTGYEHTVGAQRGLPPTSVKRHCYLSAI